MDKEVFETFIILGEKISKNILRIPFKNTQKNNPWFDETSVSDALHGISIYLEKDNMTNWLKDYSFKKSRKTIGLIAAGNIPLVGFHDLLCILISGFKVEIKPSSKDLPLTKWIIRQITNINPALQTRISLKEKLGNCDAYIATGSNNTNRYFEYEFRSKPHLLRNNRTGIAILTGKETQRDLNGLAADIFQYYGLGCRNVSLLLLPMGYKLVKLSKCFGQHQKVMDNKNYSDIYNYNKALLILGKKKFHDLGNLLLVPNNNPNATVSVLHYDFYKNPNHLNSFIRRNRELLQCIAGHRISGISTIPFGTTQTPEAWDYNDGKNTLEFLCNL
jgi:hypothetical protein